VRATVHDAADAPEVLGPADLVIDAAFGTGFRGTYSFPDPDGAPVLAVDIPSGVSGLTGVAAGRPTRALATVTFAALKPGLLLNDGPA
jgi:NAD(P)H-hydrate repair Nnr-like enzyme with NAD(P)H-hydrate epimerase domain